MMKSVTAFFLGVGSALLVSAAIVAAAVPRTTLGLSMGAGAPQIRGLDANAQAQLTALRDDALQFRRHAYIEVGALIDAAQTELSSPDADLRALSQSAEQTLLPLLLDARANRAARLAFYESLEPGQQADVRAWMQAKLARIERVHGLIGDFMTQTP